MESNGQLGRPQFIDASKFVELAFRDIQLRKIPFALQSNGEVWCRWHEDINPGKASSVETLKMHHNNITTSVTLRMWKA